MQASIVMLFLVSNGTEGATVLPEVRCNAYVFALFIVSYQNKGCSLPFHHREILEEKGQKVDCPGAG